MIVDGKAVAADILSSVKQAVKQLSAPPHLTIFTCAPDLATRKFLRLKKRKAAKVGIDTRVIELPESITTEAAISQIKSVAGKTNGIIIQLPLPEAINQTAVQQAVPTELDVDAVGYSGEATDILPPVVGAVSEIIKRHSLVLTGKKIVIVGNGSLVGQPAALWFKGQGYVPIVLTRKTDNNQAEIAKADILILGAGRPHLITPDAIKKGVAIFDAGTSEAGSKLVGDADPACSDKAALFTPVPGGIGPITVAVLLRNLVNLVKKTKPS